MENKTNQTLLTEFLLKMKLEKVLEKIENSIVNAQLLRYLKRHCSDNNINQYDEEIISRILDIILKYYRNLSLSDIERAFELAIVQKLNLKEIDYLHYGKLTPGYISRILVKYQELKAKSYVHCVSPVELKEAKEKSYRDVPGPL